MNEPRAEDPMPWRHVDGARVSDPWALNSPIGGYTYDPRPGYRDYPDRYVPIGRKIEERR